MILNERRSLLVYLQCLFICTLHWRKSVASMSVDQLSEIMDWRASQHSWEKSIQEKSEAYSHRRRAMEENRLLSGSPEQAPDWLKHEKHGLYFPVVHKDVIQSGKLGFQRENLIPRKPNRRILQGNKIAAFDVGGDWYTFGGYFITLTIGSNQQAFNVHLDTGSSLLWVGCDCQAYGCVNVTDDEVPIEIYNQQLSNTSSLLRCNTDTCNAISSPPFGNSTDSGPPVGCNILGEDGTRLLTDNSTADAILSSSDEDQNCEYLVRYLDESSTAGPLVYDDLWMQYTSGIEATQILFGCAKILTGNTNDGSSPFDGLVGLSFSNFSIKTQLSQAGLISESFSFCLEGDGLGGHLVLGRGEVPSGASSAPLLDSSYYEISVLSISLNNASVGPTSLYPYPFIVDTGSTYTLLDSSIYPYLFNAIIEALGNPVAYSVLDFYTCMLRDEVVFSEYPLDVILGTEGDPWHIPFFNFMFPLRYQNERYYCLTFFSISGLTIIGDTWLRDFDVVYDDANRLLYWLPVNCSTGASLEANSTAQLVTFPTPSAAAQTRNASSPQAVAPSPSPSPPPPSVVDSPSPPPPSVIDSPSPPPTSVIDSPPSPPSIQELSPPPPGNEPASSPPPGNEPASSPPPTPIGTSPSPSPPLSVPNVPLPQIPPIAPSVFPSKGFSLRSLKYSTCATSFLVGVLCTCFL